MLQKETTFQRINRLAEQRLKLYQKAGQQGLSEHERRLIDELTRELDRLWAQHRQELADRHRALPRWIAEKEAA